MQCLSSTNEQFINQKTDLIAELKMSKDITGIKKMKVERAKMDNRNSEVYSDVNRQFSMQSFVDTVNSLKSPFYVHKNIHQLERNTHFKHQLNVNIVSVTF